MKTRVSLPDSRLVCSLLTGPVPALPFKVEARGHISMGHAISDV